MILLTFRSFYRSRLLSVSFMCLCLRRFHHLKVLISRFFMEDYEALCWLAFAFIFTFKIFTKSTLSLLQAMHFSTIFISLSCWVNSFFFSSSRQQQKDERNGFLAQSAELNFLLSLNCLLLDANNSCVFIIMNISR